MSSFKREIYYSTLDISTKFEVTPAMWHKIESELIPYQKYLRFPDHQFMAYYYLKTEIDTLDLPIKSKK